MCAHDIHNGHLWCFQKRVQTTHYHEMGQTALSSHHKHDIFAVLASLISLQVVNLLVDLLTEVSNLLRLDLPHFAVQFNKSEGINLFIKSLTEVNNHPKT